MRARCVTAALVAALALFIAGPAPAQQRVGIGHTMVDDGGCTEAAHTLTAEYERQSDALDVRGMLRVEPSGGDCRQEALSYDVSAAKYLAAGAVDVAVEFGASEQAAAAPYALSGADGSILARADGGALFGTNLPAGSARTIIGAIGLSRSFGPMRVSGGVNLVPVDWMHHEPGRTVHLAAGFDRGGWALDASIDAGAAHFGEAAAAYRLALAETRFDVGIGLVYRWGIGAIDNGAPDVQLVNDSPFVRAGPPRDDSVLVSVTLGYSPGANDIRRAPMSGVPAHHGPHVGRGPVRSRRDRRGRRGGRGLLRRAPRRRSARVGDADAGGRSGRPRRQALAARRRGRGDRSDPPARRGHRPRARLRAPDRVLRDERPAGPGRGLDPRARGARRRHLGAAGVDRARPPDGQGARVPLPEPDVHPHARLPRRRQAPARRRADQHAGAGHPRAGPQTHDRSIARRPWRDHARATQAHPGEAGPRAGQRADRRRGGHGPGPDRPGAADRPGRARQGPGPGGDGQGGRRPGRGQGARRRAGQGARPGRDRDGRRGRRRGEGEGRRRRPGPGGLRAARRLRAPR